MSFKTEGHIFKDHCDQMHKKIAESLPLKCDQCEYINTTVKGLRQHQKIKQNGSLVDKLPRLFKCWTCEKAELTLERSPNGSNTTKTIIKKKNLNLICLNSNCNTCKESFITQLLLEVHPETKHPYHYAIAPYTVHCAKILIGVQNLED